MSEATTTLRFPERIHIKAKMAATERGLSLQDFVAQAVEAFIAAPKPKERPDPALAALAARLAALSPRSRVLADRFLDVLETAPDFYFVAIEKYIAGMQTLFRRVDRRLFESHGGKGNRKE